MIRYRPGSLEEAIKNLFFDALAEAFIGSELNEKRREIDFLGGEERPRTRRRYTRKGRVTNPNRDKRLRTNRQSQQKTE